MKEKPRIFLYGSSIIMGSIASILGVRECRFKPVNLTPARQLIPLYGSVYVKTGYGI